MNNTALLVIDIQDSFKRNRERWAQRSNPDFEANVGALLGTWREAGAPLFFVLHTDADPGFGVHDPEFRLMEFLQRREDEPLIVKNTRNAFTSTDLQARLDAKGIKKLAITGISTEQCCETTTRVAADLGYEVDFITDGTLTFPIGELSTDEIVRRTEAVLDQRFARVRTTREVLASAT
jgi:nicotinamidase-related amidase